MVFKLGHLLNMEPSDTKPRCTRNAPGLLYFRRCRGRRLRRPNKKTPMMVSFWWITAPSGLALTF